VERFKNKWYHLSIQMSTNVMGFQSSKDSKAIKAIASDSTSIGVKDDSAKL
jgi:hypothetical protein